MAAIFCLPAGVSVAQTPADPCLVFNTVNLGSNGRDASFKPYAVALIPQAGALTVAWETPNCEPSVHPLIGHTVNVFAVAADGTRTLRADGICGSTCRRLTLPTPPLERLEASVQAQYAGRASTPTAAVGEVVVAPSPEVPSLVSCAEIVRTRP